VPEYRERLWSLLPPEARLREVREAGLGLVEKPPTHVELRRWGPPFSPLDFQAEVIRGLSALLHDTSICGLLSLPTGSGKTLTASRVVVEALTHPRARSAQALWIAPQRELLAQASEALQSAWWSGFGPPSLDVRLLERSRDYAPAERSTCWLATPMMAHKLLSEFQGKLEIAVFDEAHHAAAEVFGATWEHLARGEGHPPRLALGLSATPTRERDSERVLLRQAFSDTLFVPRKLAHHATLALIEAGVLSRPEFRLIPGVPEFARQREVADLRRLQSFAADPDRWQAIIECIVERERGQTVTYALDREHGQCLTKHLRWLGEQAEYVDGDTPIGSRIGVFERFRNGETRVLVNVELMIEGVDCPAAESAVLTYPVRSHLRLRQMVGRVLRGPAVGGTAECRVWATEGSQQHLDRVLHGVEHRFAGWRIVELQ
jgi:superfamily II DNA or RNA helicase